jgi:hypothetical protein
MLFRDAYISMCIFTRASMTMYAYKENEILKDRNENLR